MREVKWRAALSGSVVEFGLRSELGKLGIHRRVESFKAWVTTSDHWPVVCALGLAASSGNLARVAQAAAEFGAPFLLLHALLSLLLGVPLALLELGLGQFAQQGATALWRAIPVLRGIAFVKLMSATILAVPVGVRIAMTGAYAVRTAAAALPMAECSQLTMAEHGYFQNNTYGLECVLRTFLKPFSEDSFWFSIMCTIIFIVWIVVPLCLYTLDTGLKFSLWIFSTIILVLCVILAIVEGENNITEIFKHTDWMDLKSSDIWFTVVWQVLLSNRLGLAYLDTVGGTIYFMSNALRWCFSLVVCNLVLSWLGVLFWFSITAGIERDTTSFAIPIWIYDSAVHNNSHRVWTSLAFIVALFSTVSTMLTLLYPVFESLSRSFKYQWRLPALLLLTAAMVCSMVSFFGGLEILELLENLIVPIVVTAGLFVQVFAFMFIYGWRNIRSDLEFMLAKRIPPYWIICLCVASVVMIGLACWDLTIIILNGRAWSQDSLTQLIILSAVVVVAIVTVLVWAVIVIVKQDEYDCFLKVKSSFSPSRKWGPVEPILRHLWIQWCSSPHTAELVAQVRTHRQGTPTSVFHIDPRLNSESSASSKSSFEGYEGRFEYRGSRKSDNGDSKVSLDDYDVYVRSLEERGSKTSSGMASIASRREGTPSSDNSGTDFNQKIATSDVEQVHYGQIKQMYY